LEARRQTMSVMQIARALVRVRAYDDSCGRVSVRGRSSPVTSHYLWQLPSSVRQYSPAWQ
ncbi:MAG TPA: hypothetical protein VKB76_17445, partial [Ktedonobacterales bacterium]|nr:hypothetical protein [Ktedonobacterales bacterium]